MVACLRALNRRSTFCGNVPNWAHANAVVNPARLEWAVKFFSRFKYASLDGIFADLLHECAAILCDVNPTGLVVIVIFS